MIFVRLQDESIREYLEIVLEQTSRCQGYDRRVARRLPPSPRAFSAAAPIRPKVSSDFFEGAPPVTKTAKEPNFAAPSLILYYTASISRLQFLKENRRDCLIS